MANNLTFEERITKFQNFIDSCLIDPSFIPDPVDFYQMLIQLSKGQIDLNEIAEKLGYSNRHLRKMFKESFGISPKPYAQILRFQSSVHKLLEPNSNLLNVTFCKVLKN
jgi:methylphosphotriester-DNA--protein-cysteine methyltransferase